MQRRIRRTLMCGLLAACTVAGCGSTTIPASFAHRANHDCTDSVANLGKLPRPPKVSGIDYTLGYYTIYERLVTELNRTRLPVRSAGQIKARWLEPARRNLVAFRASMQAVRSASNRGDTATVNAAIVRLDNLGRTGVDTEYVRRLGATECTALF